MRETKKALETKVKHFEEEIEAMNEQIWSFQKHLKEKYHRKEATLFLLREEKFIKKENWVLRKCNLENDSILSNVIYQDMSSLENFSNK